jgi:hypothetical protein
MNSNFEGLYDPLERLVLQFRKEPRLIAEIIRLNDAPFST